MRGEGDLAPNPPPSAGEGGERSEPGARDDASGEVATNLKDATFFAVALPSPAPADAGSPSPAEGGGFDPREPSVGKPVPAARSRRNAARPVRHGGRDALHRRFTTRGGRASPKDIVMLRPSRLLAGLLAGLLPAALAAATPALAHPHVWITPGPSSITGRTGPCGRSGMPGPSIRPIPPSPSRASASRRPGRSTRRPSRRSRATMPRTWPSRATSRS